MGLDMSAWQDLSKVIGTCRSADDEYYSDEYYEDEEDPSDVWGYLLNEAAKQTFGGGTKKDPSSQIQQVSTSSDSATSQSEGLLEKLFVGDASLANDPVYNWILGQT